MRPQPYRIPPTRHANAKREDYTAWITHGSNNQPRQPLSLLAGHPPSYHPSSRSALTLPVLLLALQPEKAHKTRLHPIHRLLIRLLLFRRHLLEPALAVLADILLQELVLLLALLADPVQQHLALVEAVARAQAIAHHAAFAGQALDAEGAAEQPDTGALGFPRAVEVELFVEEPARFNFAEGEFGGDVFAREGFEHGARVVELHGRDVFEEGDQRDELVVGG